MSESEQRPSLARNTWLRGLAWVPSLYFVQGLPYAVVNNVAPAMLKNLQVGNAEITFWTSWMSSVWAFKPLWSSLVDTTGTKRRWVLMMQAAMGPILALVALALPTPFFLEATIALLFVLAFLSATHDIAADGLYMLGLDQRQQAAFVGVRSFFWRMALLGGEGGLVYLSGYFAHQMDPTRAWAYTLGAASLVFVVAAGLHLGALPVPAGDRPSTSAGGQLARESVEVWRSFFRKPNIVQAVLFLVFYRFAENQLVRLITPFLLDDRADGGLGLTNEALGFAKGTVGVIALMVGGILGGLAISRWGLRACLWPMVAIIHLPDLVFVYLSWVQPTSYPLICALIGVEQFGYGFGFTAYMMFMILLADGEHKTAHYAIGTGIMALSVTLTGMLTGWLQERIGYPMFFAWVVLATIPGVIVAAIVHIPPEFGRAQR
jgi:PAT family beta-lactamase induction signal transducer AmpG